jgi:hypothetical protein
MSVGKSSLCARGRRPNGSVNRELIMESERGTWNLEPEPEVELKPEREPELEPELEPEREPEQEPGTRNPERGTFR